MRTSFIGAIIAALLLISTPSAAQANSGADVRILIVESGDEEIVEPGPGLTMDRAQSLNEQLHKQELKSEIAFAYLLQNEVFVLFGSIEHGWDYCLRIPANFDDAGICPVRKTAQVLTDAFEERDTIRKVTIVSSILVAPTALSRFNLESMLGVGRVLNAAARDFEKRHNIASR